jgi:hypothetical protein
MRFELETSKFRTSVSAQEFPQAVLQDAVFTFGQVFFKLKNKNFFVHDFAPMQYQLPGQVHLGLLQLQPSCSSTTNTNSLNSPQQ